MSCCLHDFVTYFLPSSCVFVGFRDESVVTRNVRDDTFALHRYDDVWEAPRSSKDLVVRAYRLVFVLLVWQRNFITVDIITNHQITPFAWLQVFTAAAFLQRYPCRGWRRTIYYDQNTNSVAIWTFPACSPAMFFRLRHQRTVHVYLLVFVILSGLVVLGVLIAYRAILREQKIQIRAAVDELAWGDGGVNQRFGKYKQYL